jgi:hypothetical protein
MWGDCYSLRLAEGIVEEASLGSMATTYSPAGVTLNKVVVAYLDDRRLRGCVYDFSPLKDTFRLVAESDLTQQKGAEIALKDLKAVFFVKDFRGNNRYKESKRIEEGKPGRKIEVTFSDGEKIVGTTQGYNPKGKGFFVYPADAKSNSLRIFVVNWNVRDVQFL